MLERAGLWVIEKALTVLAMAVFPLVAAFVVVHALIERWQDAK